MNTLSVAVFVTMVAALGFQSATAARKASASLDASRFASMVSDLEHLAARQAMHFIDQATYGTTPDILGFATSDGVNVSILGSSTGWSATATHANLDEFEGCTIFVGGMVAPAWPLTPPHPGEVACSQ